MHKFPFLTIYLPDKIVHEIRSSAFLSLVTNHQAIRPKRKIAFPQPLQDLALAPANLSVQHGKGQCGPFCLLFHYKKDGTARVHQR